MSSIGTDSCDDAEDSEFDDWSEEDEEEGGDGGGPPVPMVGQGVDEFSKSESISNPGVDGSLGRGRFLLAFESLELRLL